MEKLKHIRLARGETQKDFADFLGISQPYLHQLESGKRKPSHESLLKITQLLGVTVGELIGETVKRKAK